MTLYTRVIIIGGGFGGLTTAQKLKKASLDLVLIDRKNHHLFQPLLYEVASAALSPGEIGIPIREVLRKQENATVVLGEVTKIDKEKKQITLGNGDELSYDYLVLAPGARHSYFGNDAWEENAPGLKTLSDALRIREKILMSFEIAERLDSTQETAKHLNFAIIGGGPTGVEMAGAIAEIAHKTMFKNFRRIRPEKSQIYLIEAAPRLLPPFPERLSQRAKEDLEKMGVTVLVNTKVLNVTKDGVQVEGQFIEAANIIWAAGNQASPLLKELGCALDRQGRVLVERDLSVPNHPEIFVIGDAACCMNKEGKPLPAVAPVAIQQARFVSWIIKNNLKPELRPAFKYFDKGSLATIGKSKAVGFVKNIQFTGWIAWLGWCFVHIMYLIGFRNRLSVMLEWFFFYVTGQRGARLIYGAIDEEIPKHPHTD